LQLGLFLKIATAIAHYQQTKLKTNIFILSVKSNSLLSEIC